MRPCATATQIAIDILLAAILVMLTAKTSWSTRFSATRSADSPRRAGVEVDHRSQAQIRSAENHVVAALIPGKSSPLSPAASLTFCGGHQPRSLTGLTRLKGRVTRNMPRSTRRTLPAITPRPRRTFPIMRSASDKTRHSMCVIEALQMLSSPLCARAINSASLALTDFPGSEPLHLTTTNSTLLLTLTQFKERVPQCALHSRSETCDQIGPAFLICSMATHSQSPTPPRAIFSRMIPARSKRGRSESYHRPRGVLSSMQVIFQNAPPIHPRDAGNGVSRFGVIFSESRRCHSDCWSRPHGKGVPTNSERGKRLRPVTNATVLASDDGALGFINHATVWFAR